jgi:hypothetical protein
MPAAELPLFTGVSAGSDLLPKSGQRIYRAMIWVGNIGESLLGAGGNAVGAEVLWRKCSIH